MKILTLLIGLLSIIVIIVLVFVFQKSFFKEETLPAKELPLVEEFIPTDLLSSEEQKEYYTCNDRHCFEEKFGNCEKTFFKTTEDFRVTEYEILGLKNGFCNIDIKVSNEFGDFGETTCLFDNKNDKSFFEIMLEPESCDNLDAILFI